jgi:hypothetical protein
MGNSIKRKQKSEKVDAKTAAVKLAKRYTTPKTKLVRRRLGKSIYIL